MRELVRKLINIEQEIAVGRGPLVLFGLFERPETAGRWDLVVSAPWTAANRTEAIRYLSPKIRPTLSIDEVVKIGRIVPVSPYSDFVKAVTEAVRVSHGDAALVNQLFGDIVVDRAHVITSGAA